MSADKKTYWIVWNEGRTEGFITDEERDAKSCVTGRPSYHYGYASESTAGAAFRDTYDEDALSIQKVALDSKGQSHD